MNEWGENFVVRFPLPWSRWVFLNEPMAIRVLLEDVNPEKSADFTRGLDAIAKGGLLTADWREWLQERRRCAPTMTERYVGDLHRIFEEEAAFLHARLEQAAASGDPIEMDGALVGTRFCRPVRRTTQRQRHNYWNGQSSQGFPIHVSWSYSKGGRPASCRSWFGVRAFFATR